LQVDGARGVNSVILYASTNLVDWQPIYTNPPSLGSACFLDFAVTNQPRRFYRAMQHPEPSAFLAATKSDEGGSF